RMTLVEIEHRAEIAFRENVAVDNKKRLIETIAEIAQLARCTSWPIVVMVAVIAAFDLDSLGRAILPE
ncbi:MAG: hypothetical protein DMD91_27045, partial [Candidatus Rokuibacteriota bacterium]